MPIAVKQQMSSKNLATQDLAAFFKAVADTMRLEVLKVLEQDSFGVQELAAIFAMPQPGMSHHLKIMTSAGLLQARRQGNNIFYRRAIIKDRSPFSQLMRTVYEEANQISLNHDIKQRISNIYNERSKQSQVFFEKNAAKFTEHQGKLCELSQYINSVIDIIELVEPKQNESALEVGPGQGQLLVELTKRYQKVVALDNSKEMLSLTKTQTRNLSKKIEYVNNSLEGFHSDESFNLIILNMVLHHIPKPAEIFYKLKGMLSNNGYLLIADLCAHNQDWVKDSCGDVWLGFEPESLTHWGEAVGLMETQSLYLGLKNGFQIQLKLFKRH